jgi:hypothetical protein
VEGIMVKTTKQSGRVRPAILLWALGIPLPIVLLVLLFRGC